MLDEALLLDTHAWSLTRVPPPPPPRSSTAASATSASATAAGGVSGPWARAHGSLLALPQLALHMGGAKSAGAPPCDALDLQTMSWRQVTLTLTLTLTLTPTLNDLKTMSWRQVEIDTEP